MFYQVRSLLTKAVQAYLSSIGRDDIVMTQEVVGAQKGAHKKGAKNPSVKSPSAKSPKQDSQNAKDLQNTKDLERNLENAQDCILQKTILSVPLEHPKDRAHGHFATPICFVLTKVLRTNPKTLAQSLQDFFMQYDREQHRGQPFPQMFAAIESVHGYLNLTLGHEFLIHSLEKALANPQDFAKGEDKKTRILLEYVSANPTGPLHIGHARGAIFGSTLQRIGRRLGYDIVGEYYVNDAGSQIDMLALSVYNSAAKILGLTPKEGEVYKGEYIDDVAKAAIECFGRDFFMNETPNLEAIGLYAKDMMLSVIQDNLRSLDICFDYFASEKDLYSRFDETMRALREHGALLDKDGAVWLQSSLRGDEKDRVLVRDNGMPTYMAGDIIYHKDKFDRDYDHYINIWGADHHGYIARIQASIEFLGFDSGDLEVLLAQMVSLLKDGQPYKMSKRAGNFILIQDVVQDIGADSLKFVFLTKSLDTHLEFDVNELSKEDSSNPIFYINYANARIHTLLEKSTSSIDQICSCDMSALFAAKEGDESLRQDSMQLILQSLGLLHVLYQSYDERALQKLCEYLKNLAKALHTFYNAHKILQTQYELQILKILQLVSLSLTTGFAMLGIEIKTKM